MISPTISIFASILTFNLELNSRLPGLSLLLLGSLMACIEIFRAIKNPGNSAISNGNVWVLASLLLIFVVSPGIRLLTKAQLPLVFAIRDTSTQINQVNSLAAIAIFSTILSNRLQLNKGMQLTGANSVISKNEYRPSRHLSIVIFSFWIVLYLYWAFSQGNSLAAIFGTRSSQQMFGVVKSNGYLIDSLYGALGVLTAWLAYAVHKNDKKLIMKITFGSFLFIIPSFLQGDRSKFIFYILVISIILTSFNKKINKKYILISILLIPILVVAPRMYRQSAVDLRGVGEKAFSVTNIADTFTKEDTAMSPALSILINNLGTNIPYQYGLSYFNLIAKPIPRTLWPGKPIEFDTQMMKVLFPKYAEQGVGFAFSAISEPLVNFGILGVVLFFIALGTINAKLLKRLRGTPSPLNLFLNAWIAGFMFVLIRGNLSVDFQRAVFPLFSGLIVLLLSNKKAGYQQA